MRMPMHLFRELVWNKRRLVETSYCCIAALISLSKVGKEKAIADEEEKKVGKINEEVSKKQRDCERDLEKAEPALNAAVEALNTLNKVCTLYPSKAGRSPHTDFAFWFGYGVYIVGSDLS
jgi:hypothetical protein